MQLWTWKLSSPNDMHVLWISPQEEEDDEEEEDTRIWHTPYEDDNMHKGTRLYENQRGNYITLLKLQLFL